MNEPRHLIGCALSLILLYSLQQQAPTAEALEPEAPASQAAFTQPAHPPDPVDVREPLDGQMQANALLEVVE